MKAQLGMISRDPKAPILRSVWMIRKTSSTPSHWDRVIVHDMDDFGMVAILPALGSDVARDARTMGQPVRWMPAKNFVEKYEGV